jgi:predicted lipid-binding transport protein (Tim44 family)
MGNPFDPMNIVLVLFAVVAFVRLRAALGKRTGNEDPLTDGKTIRSQLHEETKAPALKEKTMMSTEEVLKQLSINDKNFSAPSFTDGAKNAYKMIVTAYAEGDLKQVKSFLSKDVLSGFSAAIQSRKKSGQELFNKIVDFNEVSINGAILLEKTVEITVSFETKIISYATDKTGQTIEGNQDSPQNINDIWVFEKSIKGRDTNWLLISTGADD